LTSWGASESSSRPTDLEVGNPKHAATSGLIAQVSSRTSGVTVPPTGPRTPGPASPEMQGNMQMPGSSLGTMKSESPRARPWGVHVSNLPGRFDPWPGDHGSSLLKL
jgi:hypothetical protein